MFNFRLFSRRGKSLGLLAIVLLLFGFYSLKSSMPVYSNSIGSPSAHSSSYKGVSKAKTSPQDPDSVVMLIVSFDDHYDSSRSDSSSVFLDKVLSDRTEYALRHGYTLVHKKARDIQARYGVYGTWSIIPALRETLAEYPDAGWIWLLDAKAVIMNPSESLKDRVLKPEKLSQHLLLNSPIDPLKNYIRTRRKMDPSDVFVITTSDYNGISTRSLLIKNNNFAPFLLDAWNEPLLKSAGFDQAERSALSHLLEAHNTILDHVALVSPKVLNSYTNSAVDLNYEEGDFLVILQDCENAAACERIFDNYYQQRKLPAIKKQLSEETVDEQS
ncbi:Alpha-1,2-galactosyltransferase [Schizosaccharomyces pombe]|uniref:Uncharacterized alpha-1,2-galactosyltransferase C8D2.17 n=1 Tax=Schizosaccharomyces pombe (strain 972 / ATCC 24843) TaxID=284812 RepID=YGWH_SCHPO|nr:putative alpha-1,2-galactosyltransferase [Schizosaccharomyces pombe]O13640.2 RecName: Full=Uncharacterized alpha-1,2-galactosyltransferase C8D2.17; Flags: Precursor [Schizosaccharomyces pombe 972h-]CAA17832.2 alpha-1,2-galactosyltransferase (predicted) [Schizosaccharomyces pombe]|eukprot:NP_595579.2 putative alpha-1,2-galactosyltransferase [Schizosaccharomyces pombe]